MKLSAFCKDDILRFIPFFYAPPVYAYCLLNSNPSYCNYVFAAEFFSYPGRTFQGSIFLPFLQGLANPYHIVGSPKTLDDELYKIFINYKKFLFFKVANSFLLGCFH